MDDHRYPEISEIFARKAEARLARAKLPYWQKILIVEKMRREVQPLREAGRRHREQKAAQATAKINR